MYLRRLALWSVTLGLLVFSGCNVFEGFYEEGASGDPTILTQDAEAALADGRPADAIKYAQKALEKDPTHVSAVNVLATAELKEAKVDVVTMTEFVDVLTLKAEETVGKQSAVPLLAKSVSSTASCPATSSYECDFCEVGELKNFEAVTYRDLEAYQRLRNARDAFTRIDAAFDPLFVFLMDEIAEVEAVANLNDAFATETYREMIWGLLLQRAIDLGVEQPERLVAEFLKTVAIVRVASSVGEVATDAEDQQIAIFKVNPRTSDETFSYCAASIETVENYVDNTVCDKVRELQTAIDILRARQENYSRAARDEDDPVQMLIDEADDALEDYRNSESYGRCGGL